jgi:hypothetical protein
MAKQEIVAVTAYTITEKFDNDENAYLVLESNILELDTWDITKRTTNTEIKSYVSTLLVGLGFPSTFYDQVHIVTDEGSSVLNLNDNSIRCAAHMLNTIAKHITKPYSKRVVYTDEQRTFAETLDELLSDVNKFIGKVR